MTILSLVLVVGCCYHQQYMMNCNYDMPVSECPAMVTNTKQDEVDDYKDEFALFKMNLKDNSKTFVREDIIYEILGTKNDNMLFVASYKDKDECYSDGIYISGMDIKNEICLGGYLVT